MVVPEFVCVLVVVLPVVGVDVVLVEPEPIDTLVDGAELPITPEEQDHPPLTGSQSTRGAIQDAS